MSPIQNTLLASYTTAAIAPVAGRQMHVLDRPASVQTSLVLGVPAVDRVHADFLPLVVASRVLGGSPVARLALELRNKRGITYSAVSQLNAFKHGGDWRAYGDMNATRNAEAIDGFLAEVTRIASEPVPDQELDQAKRSMVASFALTLEQLPQLVAYMSMRRSYGLSADYWDRFPEKIMAVSQADVQRVAAKYMDPSRMQIVAVGDASQLVPLLAPHGKVIVYGSDGRPK